MAAQSVLVIEDDEALAYAIRRDLQEAGYDVHVVGEVDGGFEHLESAPNRPCVVVLDLLLPGKDGYQFLFRVRNDLRLSRIPVIVLTGALALGETLRSYRPNAIIHKPYDRERLLATIAEHC